MCGNKDFQKALAEIQLDKSPWIEMLAQGELGRNNAGSRAATASSSSSGSSRARSSTSSSLGQVRIHVAPCMKAEAPAPGPCMQAEAPAHVAHPTRRQDLPARRSVQQVQADPHPFLDGSVNAAACRIHVSMLLVWSRSYDIRMNRRGSQEDSGAATPRRAIWRTGHAADRANIQKQKVRSDWHGSIITRPN